MKKFALAIAAAAAVVALPASATKVVDQSQNNTKGALMYIAGNTVLSQSFTAGFDNIVGAGLFVASAGFGTAITVNVVSGNPLSGGRVIATGKGNGITGSWVDVSWAQTALVVGQTYWITATAASITAFSYAFNNPYAGGSAVYGYLPVSTGDLAFRTFSNETVATSNETAATVPEAGTWGMMIGGFGMMGLGLRRRAKVSTAVSYA